MDWFFSGVLVAASAGITGFAGYLLWRLFRAEPGPADAVTGAEPAGDRGGARR